MGAITTNSILKSIGTSAFRDCDQFTGDLIIPESVNEIGSSAFQNCSGFNGRLILPDNRNKFFASDKLTAINSYTFLNCTGFVGPLTLPDNGFKQVYNSAFKNCGGLEFLTRGEDQTTFGTSSFENCVGLSNILDLQGAVSNIAPFAFRNCKNLAGVKLGGKVKIINDQAFSGCSGMEGGIFLNSNITNVGESAFRDCSGLGYIESKVPVANLGQNALRIQSQPTSDKLLYVPDNKFESYRVAGNPNNYYDGNLLLRLRDNIQQTEYYNASRVPIASGVFEVIPQEWQIGNNNGHFLEIGASVNRIGNSAFRDNLNLKGTIVIPGTVKNLGVSCFTNCPNVTDFLIGEGLENIERGSFRGCNGLTNITLPESLKTVDNVSFNGCVNLNKITIPNPTRVGSLVGYKYLGLEPTFGNCHSLRSVVIGNSLPSNLSRGIIGSYAFKSCGKDVVNGTVYVLSSIDLINEYAFDGKAENGSYPWIRQLTIEAREIQPYAFRYQSNITILRLRDSVKRIRDFAFQNCTSIKQVFAKEINYVHKFAFEFCPNINFVQFGNSYDSAGGRTIFANAMRKVGQNLPNATVTIGKSINVISDAAFFGDFPWIEKLQLENINVGTSAFRNQTNLTTLTTPNATLRVIGYRAFENCSSLTSDLRLDYNGISIAANAFFGCPVGHVFLDTPINKVTATSFSNAMIGNIYVRNATSQGWTIGVGTGPGGNNVYNWNNYPAYTPN